MTQNAAVAAIVFALKDDDGLNFLQCWNEGNFSAIRKEWPEAPESVFIGADPSHPQTGFESSEQDEFVGRMYECCDIEMAITSGQFKKMDDVLHAVRASSAAIEKKLKEAGVQFAKSGKAGDPKHDAYMAGTLMDLKQA